MKILLGYMGCGKSSVAKELHQKYGLSYCDLDVYIKEKEKLKISDIFKEKGEIYFRKIEHEYLKEIIKTKTFDILALGGGTPCYADNMSLIKSIQNIKSIYLKIDLEDITQRLFDLRQKRPLIADIDDKNQLRDFIRKHLFEREFYYRQSDFILNTSNMTIDDIAKKILKY